MEGIMASKRHIELQVDWHPSGNLTLKERAVGEMFWTDVKGLLGKRDAASFYRSVALRLADYASQGIVVEKYMDAGPHDIS